MEMSLEESVQKVKSIKLIRFIFYPIIILRRVSLRIFKHRHVYYSELFSNVTEGSLVVKIKDVAGNFEIDARSEILQRILIRKGFEPETVLSIKRNVNIDKDAINVGANVGIFTVLLANLINEDRKVLAVEPTPLAFEYLTKNVNRNKLENKVVFYNGLCVDKKGTYTLNVIRGMEEFSSLGESNFQSIFNKPIEEIEVEGETMDNLVINNNFSYKINPGTIVIDVEGAEMNVLKGAKSIIGKFRPIIILEIHGDLLEKQGSSSKEVINYLLNEEYSVCNLTGRKIKHPFTGNIIAKPMA
jgi:FkbM family methyltransferase